MILTKKEYIFTSLLVGDVLVKNTDEIQRIAIKEYGYVDSVFFENGEIITTTDTINLAYKERKKS